MRISPTDTVKVRLETYDIQPEIVAGRAFFCSANLDPDGDPEAMNYDESFTDRIGISHVLQAAAEWLRDEANVTPPWAQFDVDVYWSDEVDIGWIAEVRWRKPA
jgi:hypothetical protein